MNYFVLYLGSPKVSRHSSHLKRSEQSSSPTLGSRKPANNRTENVMKYNKINTNHSTPPLSSDEDSDINIEKLKTIRNKAAQQ